MIDYGVVVLRTSYHYYSTQSARVCRVPAQNVEYSSAVSQPLLNLCTFGRVEYRVNTNTLPTSSFLLILCKVLQGVGIKRSTAVWCTVVLYTEYEYLLRSVSFFCWDNLTEPLGPETSFFYYTNQCCYECENETSNFGFPILSERVENLPDMMRRAPLFYCSCIYIRE